MGDFGGPLKQEQDIKKPTSYEVMNRDSGEDLRFQKAKMYMVPLMTWISSTRVWGVHGFRVLIWGWPQYAPAIRVCVCGRYIPSRHTRQIYRNETGGRTGDWTADVSKLPVPRRVHPSQCVYSFDNLVLYANAWIKASSTMLTIDLWQLLPQYSLTCRQLFIEKCLKASPHPQAFSGHSGPFLHHLRQVILVLRWTP